MKSCVAIVAALLAASISGCAGKDREENGTTRVYPHPMDRTWSALQRAVADLDFRFEENRHDELGGTIRARRASGNEVILRAEGLQKDRTTVTVVAPSGDRSIEEAILRRISDRLESRPSAEP